MSNFLVVTEDFYHHLLIATVLYCTSACLYTQAQAFRQSALLLLLLDLGFAWIPDSEVIRLKLQNLTLSNPNFSAKFLEEAFAPSIDISKMLFPRSSFAKRTLLQVGRCLPFQERLSHWSV